MPSNTIPELRTIPRPFLVASSRAWNSILDEVFYDVESLSRPEQVMLLSQTSVEGSVLIVYPGGADRKIRIVTPLVFVREQSEDANDAVDTVVVAGVGSSAMGRAALAREVADFLHRPVAGIVSGLGMADVLTEALGGWFIFGATNALRDILARTFDAWDLKDHVRDPETHRDLVEHFLTVGIDEDRFIYGSPDSTALLYLLSKLGDRIKLLVGHSKGNYSIENALEGWLSASEKTSSSIPFDLCVVTLGAVIRFPEEFTNVHQFIGQEDFFGMLNSRPLLDCTLVAGAWHTLNTLIPGHLPVNEALSSACVLRAALRR